MLNWKKLQTAVLLLAVTAGSGLLISPYIRIRHQLPPPTASKVTNVNGYKILRGDDDDPQPDQIAQVVINAQEIAEVGELVRFDLSESVAQSFKWLMVPESIDFETYYDGRFAVFSARKPGSYMFIVACAYDGIVDVKTHTVVIEGPVVPIHVDPPNLNSSLDIWVTYWCWRSKCQKPETEALAGSFEAIGAQIAAGVLQTADDIVKATAEANRTALGGSLPEWMSVLKELQGRMKTAAEQGRLSTPDQHRVMWLSIAKGLRCYAALMN